MPITWNAEEAAKVCNKINVEKISPILDSTTSVDGPFRPVLYVSFAAAFRSEVEPYLFLSRSGAKLVKEDGSKMLPEEMRRERVGKQKSSMRV